MKAQVLIDFLTFTIQKVKNWENVVRNILLMDPKIFKEQDRGGLGYNSSVRYDNIIIYYNGREDMGICVSMSGTGCRTYEAYSDDTEIVELLKKIIKMRDKDEASANITRIDIAADDKKGSLNLEKMLECLRERKVNTRLRMVCEQKSYNLGKESEKDAISFYLGSNKSDFRYRIYDKAKEQGDLESHLVRVELVNRSSYALGAAKALINAGEDIGKCIAAMIRASLLFIEADNSRIERCSVAEWWDEFLETLETLKYLEKIKTIHTAEKLYCRIEDQLSRTLAMGKMLFGEQFIMRVATEGEKKLTKEQQALVNDYLNRMEKEKRKKEAA